MELALIITQVGVLSATALGSSYGRTSTHSQLIAPDGGIASLLSTQVIWATECVRR